MAKKVRQHVAFAIDMYRPSGIKVSMPANSVLDQTLAREDGCEVFGQFAATASHRLIRWEIEPSLFDRDGTL